jgi:hypothetical protein
LLLSFILAVPSWLTVYAVEADAEGYILIGTVSELKAVQNNPTGKYKLSADIDLSAESWSPLGYGKSFKGTFDGSGHIIRGLWCAKNGLGYKGLFSTLEGATVKNLTIELDDRGITGIYECGGLAGVTKKGAVIDNVVVKGGKIVVTGGGYAGGLIGVSHGGPADTVTNCSVINTVIQTSGNYSGGFIGVLEGSSVIRDSKCVNTQSTGTSYISGFAGAVKGQSLIENCAANGSADGTGSYPGGFAGVIYEKSTVKNCQAAGNVNAALSYAGGFAGAVYNDSTVIDCKAEGNVNAKLSYAGGFAGAVYNESDIAGATAYGDVKAKHYAGGLIGTIYDDSTLFKSCAYGNVSLTGGYIAGGLIGEAVGSTIYFCYARGDVNGGTGAATGVGGLVGYFSLVGSKTVNYCYSSGKVTGKGTAEYGGFCGMTGVISLGANYYDSDKAGTSSATGTSGHPQGLNISFPQGRSTADMMRQDTYKGWDFVNLWGIDEGASYPYFR